MQVSKYNLQCAFTKVACNIYDVGKLCSIPTSVTAHGYYNIEAEGMCTYLIRAEPTQKKMTRQYI
jgi:hypothetical protein